MDIRRIKAEDTWPIRHQVMWPNKDIEYIKLKHDQDGFHFGLFLNDQCISVISLFKDNQSAQFRKFATLDDYQNKGYGTVLLEYVINLNEQLEFNHLWCNARIEKAHYYEKFGLIKTDQNFIKDQQTYIVMERKFYE